MKESHITKNIHLLGVLRDRGDEDVYDAASPGVGPGSLLQAARRHPGDGQHHRHHDPGRSQPVSAGHSQHLPTIWNRSGYFMTLNKCL